MVPRNFWTDPSVIRFFHHPLSVPKRSRQRINIWDRRLIICYDLLGTGRGCDGNDAMSQSCNSCWCKIGFWTIRSCNRSSISHIAILVVCWFHLILAIPHFLPEVMWPLSKLASGMGRNHENGQNGPIGISDMSSVNPHQQSGDFWVSLVAAQIQPAWTPCQGAVRSRRFVVQVFDYNYHHHDKQNFRLVVQTKKPPSMDGPISCPIPV